MRWEWTGCLNPERKRSSDRSWGEFMPGALRRRQPPKSGCFLLSIFLRSSHKSRPGWWKSFSPLRSRRCKELFDHATHAKLFQQLEKHPVCSQGGRRPFAGAEEADNAFHNRFGLFRGVVLIHRGADGGRHRDARRFGRNQVLVATAKVSSPAIGDNEGPPGGALESRRPDAAISRPAPLPECPPCGN